MECTKIVVTVLRFALLCPLSSEQLQINLSGFPKWRKAAALLAHWVLNENQALLPPRQPVRMNPFVRGNVAH
jgi:hypothetical protein